MNATKRIVCLFAIGMCVFAGSSMAFDLGGMLKQVEKAAQQIDPNQNKSAQPPTNQTNQGQSASQPASQSAVYAVNATASNTANFCDRVQATEVYQKYAKMVGDAVKGNYYAPLTDSKARGGSFFTYQKTAWTPATGKVDIGKYDPQGKLSVGKKIGENDVALNFDSTDRLLLQWILSKRNNLLVIADHPSPTSRYSSGTEYMYQIGAQEKGVVAACFDQLLPTDFAYIFLSTDEISILRKKAPVATQPKTVVRREVTASGEVIEKSVEESNPDINSKLSAYKKIRDEMLFDYGYSHNFPHWLALLDGGEKVLDTTGTEFLGAYTVALGESKVMAEKKTDKEEKAKIEEGKKEEAKKKELSDHEEAKKKELSDHNERIALAIKTGDLSKLRGCDEFAETKQGVKFGVSALDVIYPPTKTFTIIAGVAGVPTLVSHKDLVGGSEELIEIRNVGKYSKETFHKFGKLSLNKKTLRFGQAKVGVAMFAMGDYSSNDSIGLTNGTTVDIPVYEASCVEYFSSF